MIIRCAEDFLQAGPGWYLTMYYPRYGHIYPGSRLTIFLIGCQPEINQHPESRNTQIVKFSSRKIADTGFSYFICGWIPKIETATQERYDWMSPNLIMKDLTGDTIWCVNRDICGILDDLPVHVVIKHVKIISSVIEEYKEYPAVS